jgi:hypothetical protein
MSYKDVYLVFHMNLFCFVMCIDFNVNIFCFAKSRVHSKTNVISNYYVFVFFASFLIL